MRSFVSEMARRRLNCLVEPSRSMSRQLNWWTLLALWFTAFFWFGVLYFVFRQVSGVGSATRLLGMLFGFAGFATVLSGLVAITRDRLTDDG